MKYIKNTLIRLKGLLMHLATLLMRGPVLKKEVLQAFK
jgi:hypothetical protein